MSRRSLVTPLIVAVLLSVATGVTVSTADSSPAPTSGAARPAPDVPVTGLVVGDGLSRNAADDLSEAFPGWTVDVAPTHRAQHRSPVVVLALPPSARRWRPYLLRYAADVLPARTTVVFQSPGKDQAATPRQARRTAALLSRDTAPRHRR
ncbi:hypothetical protein [Nocardioides sp. GXQ0305]|uniref:hypothetical protein n=1 Tax=Nocardioides sp. GXQ0305 TaxID=3423912 RepID=UPI003D7E9E07